MSLHDAHLFHVNIIMIINMMMFITREMRREASIQAKKMYFEKLR